MKRHVLAGAVVVLGSAAAQASTLFGVTNLVTDDQMAHPAQITDLNLVNAWGVSYVGSGPFWVSAQQDRDGDETTSIRAPTRRAGWP